MKISTALLFLLILTTAVGLSDSSAQSRPSDEVLILLSVADATDAVGANLPLSIYHRFSHEVLAGCSRTLLPRLMRRAGSLSIVDAAPEGNAYAIVTRHPSGEPLVESGMIQNRSIRSVDGLDIIRGSAGDFSMLRAAGYSCVEIAAVPLAPARNPEYLSGAYPLGKTAFIDSVLGLVSTTSITSIIQGLQDFGTRYWSNANRDAVASWVRLQFYNTGIKSVVIDSFQYSGTWQKNVVATIPGTVNPSAEIIIGGHMDSYSSNVAQAPGADDNASGTAAAIEMARVLKQIGYQPAYTLRFIGFGTEEAGLIGSGVYAQRARTQGQDIRVMQNYDMIANRTQTQTDRDYYQVWYAGAQAYSDLHAAMARTYTTLTPVQTTSYRSGSDSYSFYQQSYNATFCIERDFSPYYHSPNDLIGYLDMNYAADIIRSGLAMLLTLDAAPPSVPNLTITEKIDGTSLRVQWDSVAVPDFSMYRISWGTEPGVYTGQTTQTTRQKTITGLTTGIRYYVGVSIVDMVGREGMITEVSGVPRLAPFPPEGMTAEGVDHAVLLTWNEHPDPDVTGFHLYRSENLTGPYLQAGSPAVPETSFVDSLFTPGVRYYYLRAVDAADQESEPSDTVEAAPIVNGVSVSVSLNERWNLVSVPVLTAHDLVTELFPSSTFPYVYEFNGATGYQQATRLSGGVGYWLKSSGAAGAEIFGNAVTTDSVAVIAGWNLVGSISVPVAVNDVGSDPPGLTLSEFFAFNGSYMTSDTIQPGRAYWVKSTADGSLILSDAGGLRGSGIHIVPTSELPPPPPDNLHPAGIPVTSMLDDAYPNPFNPVTVIGYSLHVDGYVTVKVYDILGREVASLVDETKPAGEYAVTWDAGENPGGIYFCRLQSGRSGMTKKLVLVK